MIELFLFTPFLCTAQLLKRRRGKDIDVDACQHTSNSSSSSTTSLTIDEESDEVDKDDAATTQSIHTNTPVDELHPEEEPRSMPIQLQDPIFTAAMVHLHKQAESSS